MRWAATNGYTLIELLMVMVIVGVLAAYAVPRWSPGDATVAAQGYRLARDLRHTQAMAMNQGRTLSLEPLMTGYRVTDGVSPVTDPAIQQTFQISLDEGVTISGGNVRFDSLGRPVDGSGALLAGQSSLVLNGVSRSATVVVAPITGFVTVTP